jgi:hypothetical protein
MAEEVTLVVSETTGETVAVFPTPELAQEFHSAEAEFRDWVVVEEVPVSHDNTDYHQHHDE